MMSDLFIKVHNQLPIFKIDHKQFLILYTPGYLLTLNKNLVDEVNTFVKNPDIIEDQYTRDNIFNLLKKARESVENWELQKQLPFSAECLTIHVGSECNLNCTYCYSKVDKTGNNILNGFPDLNAIKSVAQYIAERRNENPQKLTIVYHGAGEPTFHWQELVESYQSISTIAQKNNLQIFAYIATNGYLSEVHIDWLAENMDLIGISCDGPPSIQNKQRIQNAKDYLPIEKVCKRILKKGGQFDIRTTITKETISKQLEIAKYLIDDCNAKNIRFEPIYLAGKYSFKEEQADTFLSSFLEAQNYAKEHEVNLSYSGVRIDEQHGTYCDVLRNTVRLTPDGLSRNCFCFMKTEPEYITGEYNKNISVFKLSHEIKELKEKAFQMPNECNNCINVFHCSRGCPEFCMYEENSQLDAFKCRLHQLYSVEIIKSLAEKKIANC